jgi:hypothetical protein
MEFLIIWKKYDNNKNNSIKTSWDEFKKLLNEFKMTIRDRELTTIITKSTVSYYNLFKKS